MRDAPPSSFATVVSAETGLAPLICLSHLRWDFVFQRPQHLMTRFAQRRPVVYFEEPVRGTQAIGLEVRICPASGVRVATPQVPDGIDGPCLAAVQRQLLDELIADLGIEAPVLWFYTPMMLPVARHLEASAVVYDCMDELANFHFAPPELLGLEDELLDRADVVFTGGYSLYEAKRERHPRVHAFPSSVDREHFAQARSPGTEPSDQTALGQPRFGYFGVIDERLDLSLISQLADARPDWSIVMVGPVVKISPEDLPRRANIHWLGGRSYDALPAYLRGWDVALMPFAMNEATRFISPTKTPEYLSAGRPVVSTPVRDVVRQYGDVEGVVIAEAEGFVPACEAALSLARQPHTWLPQVDDLLGQMSWDQTFLRMNRLIEVSMRPERRRAAPNAEARVFPATPPARRDHYDVLVVGAGFAGTVMAERLASQDGKRVLVVDRRPHIGGNAYDHTDADGLLVHAYGPHIFHTNSRDVFDYLSRFTRWRAYEHRVLAEVRGQQVPIPINRTTLSRLFGVTLPDDASAAAFLAERAEAVDPIRTSEDVVVNAVGRELYELFFQGYTRKQWGLDPSDLDRSVTARIPTRTDTDDRYFTDTFQAMPAQGYTAMFRAMLDHPLIEVETGVDFRDVEKEVAFDHLVFTGPIDEFFGHRYGPLPYRSLTFRHETLDQARFQSVGTVNYPDENIPYTRVTEFKHLTGQSHPRTSVVYEYPSATGDPYYPVPRPENQALYKRYEALALARPDVTFVGRLASYRYYNMDQVVGQALATHRRLSQAGGGAVDPVATGFRPAL